MTGNTSGPVSLKHPLSLKLAFQYALRELRSGFSGFFGFLFCIALGVGGIATVGTFSQAIRGGLVEEGRTLLGGDIEFALRQRTVTVNEHAALAQFGTVSEVATMRAMAQSPAQDTQSLIELKAVDSLYPLYGQLRFGQELGRGGASDEETSTEVRVDATLLTRLDIKVGDDLKIGAQVFKVVGTVTSEPDRISSGFLIGPRVLMSRQGLDKTGLVQPGSLVRWRYRVKFKDQTNLVPDDVATAIKKAFPLSGWRIKSRDNAAPGVNRFVDRLTVFLTLVGFTTLLVGGVGIANSVKSYIDTKRSVIATYKCLGATGQFITNVYLLQIMVVAAVGIGIGLVAGAIIPLIGLYFFGSSLPMPARVGLYWEPLFISALFGILTAFAFAIWPLGRVREIAPSALFRDMIVPAKQTPHFWYGVLFLITCGALAALLVFTSIDRFISAWFVVGASVGFLALGLVALGLMALMRKFPLFSMLELRLAVSNIHRPGSATPSAILSLGLGLTLLVTLMLIDKNLVRQLGEEMPDKAPSFFFVDIQRDQIGPFEALVRKSSELSDFTKVPMLRGRLVSLKGVDVAKINPPPEARWVLRGDRGITYASSLPKGSRLIEGKWWPEDYAGAPLVSFTHELAAHLKLTIGDKITVNVLGRNITATIANTRAVEWRSFGINFVMVFTPNTLAMAPHTYLSTVSLPEQAELGLLKSVSKGFANITSIRVRDVLGSINDLLVKLIMAIRGASSLSFLAAIVVLAGAISAGRSQRTYDAVILKTLGAPRKLLLRSYCFEYGILGGCAGLFAVLAGSLAAYLIVEHVLDARFVFFPGLTIGATLAAAFGTIVVGLMSSWRILGEKPAAILRSQN